MSALDIDAIAEEVSKVWYPIGDVAAQKAGIIAILRKHLPAAPVVVEALPNDFYGLTDGDSYSFRAAHVNKRLRARAGTGTPAVKIPWRVARTEMVSALSSPEYDTNYVYQTTDGEIGVSRYTGGKLENITRWCVPGQPWVERTTTTTRVFDELPTQGSDIVVLYDDGARRVVTASGSPFASQRIVAWCYESDALAALPAPEAK